MKNSHFLAAICLPAVLISALAQPSHATALTFNNPVTTSVTMDGSSCTLLLPCAGTLNKTIETGGVSVYTSIGAFGGDNRLFKIFKNGPVTDLLQLSWSGTGSGTIPTAIPLDWDFFVVPGLGVLNPQVELQFDVNGMPLGSSSFTPLTSLEVAGQLLEPTGGLAGSTLNTWSYTLSVSFEATFPGESVAVNIPFGHTLDVGTAATLPEPGSWWMAAAGLAGLIAAVRKVRRLG